MSTRTIIISDTHLTDRFDRPKFEYLARIFEDVDRIILNGDFWDSYLTTFNAFITSEWGELFAILRQRETYYVNGNHDPALRTDDRISRFAQWNGESYRLDLGRLRLLIEHGHRIIPSFDAWLPWVADIRPVARAAVGLESLGARLFGRAYFTVNKPRNQLMKRWARKHLAVNEILVCGHSHYLEQLGGAPFINSGFVRHGLASYIRIDNESIRLIQERY